MKKILFQLTSNAFIISTFFQILHFILFIVLFYNEVSIEIVLIIQAIALVYYLIALYFFNSNEYSIFDSLSISIILSILSIFYTTILVNFMFRGIAKDVKLFSTDYFHFTLTVFLLMLCLYSIVFFLNSLFLRYKQNSK